MYPCPCRMLFHSPFPRGIITGTDLALSCSSALMSMVATCANTVDLCVAGLDLRASPSSPAARVSSPARWRPCWRTSVNGYTLWFFPSTNMDPSAPGPTSILCLRWAGTVTWIICSNACVCGFSPHTASAVGYSPRTSLSALATVEGCTCPPVAIIHVRSCPADGDDSLMSDSCSRWVRYVRTLRGT